jgi:hypothetical protein
MPVDEPMARAAGSVASTPTTRGEAGRKAASQIDGHEKSATRHGGLANNESAALERGQPCRAAQRLAEERRGCGSPRSMLLERGSWPQAELAKHHGGRTEPGEGGLEQVRADERGENEPVRADKPSEREADQQQAPGQEEYGTIDVHGKSSFERDALSYSDS